MTNSDSFPAGLLVGFAIAVPIGPMGLLCIKQTLASGMKTGISTGLGAATVNVTYGAVILLGLDTLTPWMVNGRRLLSALSGLFLLWSAARLLMRRHRLQEESVRPAPSPLAAYGSAVAFNVTNPMAPIVMLALLSPMTGRSTPSFTDAILLLAGMFIAATAWWVCLSGGVALLRERVSPTMMEYLNRAVGLLLTVYGALALTRSVQM